MDDSDNDYNDYEFDPDRHAYEDDDTVHWGGLLDTNEDRNLLTKSNVGCLNRPLNDYFCNKWSVSNVFQYFEPSKTLCLQSPEFKTGTNNDNIWILKLIIREQFSATNVQLHLISCNEPIEIYFYLSLLNEKNKKVKQSVKLINVDSSCQGKMICQFDHFITQSYFYNEKFTDKKLSLLCEMINSCKKKITTMHTKSDDLRVFLRNEKLSDVTVCVGEAEFHLHKAILASRSEVFLAMFTHDTKENRENLVEITDVEERVMKKVIVYMYTDEIVNIEEDAGEILVVADKYQMKGLKSICNKELSNYLTCDTVFTILTVADTYNAKKLKTDALNFIALNLTKLIDLPGYQKLRNEHPHLVENILLTVAKNLKGS